ncbi:MAG: DUF222 domain-containing protein [Mycobacterium sp.]
MFESMSTAELVESISAGARQESMLIATRMSQIAELLGRRTAEAEAEDPDCGYMIITGLQRTSAEVGAALNLPSRAASDMVSHADALDIRLPKIAALLARGEVDWNIVQPILAHTELLSDRAAAAVDDDLAARISRWHCWSRRRIINAVDSTVRAKDPDACRERERGENRRYLRIIARRDGTAKVDGVISAEAAAALGTKVSALTDGVCSQDPRTLDQRRADSVMPLAAGQTMACTCGLPDCGSATEKTCAPTRIVINFLADANTGYLPGFGILDDAQLQSLHERATIRLLEEPVVTGAQSLRYQPSAAVERWVRYRDLTCRFPGCTRPAEHCDLDHTVPFNHDDPAAGGHTLPENLKCLCRAHHRVKTFVEGWRDVQLADGTVVWTSPTGRVYRTSPAGADLFPRFARTACPAPEALQRNRSEASDARKQRSRMKNQRLRPANEAARHDYFHREREIGHLQWRNEFRRKLILFKGRQPSTSPFSTWVNDPYESEELLADWRPPPLSDQTPDDPPF